MDRTVLPAGFRAFPLTLRQGRIMVMKSFASNGRSGKETLAMTIWRFLIWSSVVVALVTLTGCATPEVRPELAVITFPIDDVWVTFVQVVKEWRFELQSIESSTHVITAVKDTTTVVGATRDAYQRFAGATRPQHHDLRVSMQPRGDKSTAIEIRYTIDKLPDEDAGFALINAVRERLALEGR
jgi:hypothetical protein